MSLGSLTPEPEFLTHVVLPVDLCMSHIGAQEWVHSQHPQRMLSSVAMMTVLVRNEGSLTYRKGFGI